MKKAERLEARNLLIAKKFKKPVFTSRELKGLARTLAKIEAKGFDLTDTFPVGILDPDGIEFTYRASPDQLGTLVDHLGKNLHHLRPKYEIFPIGILAPEYYFVKGFVGRRQEQVRELRGT